MRRHGVKIRTSPTTVSVPTGLKENKAQAVGGVVGKTRPRAAVVHLEEMPASIASSVCAPRPLKNSTNATANACQAPNALQSVWRETFTVANVPGTFLGMGDIVHVDRTLPPLSLIRI